MTNHRSYFCRSSQVLLLVVSAVSTILVVESTLAAAVDDDLLVLDLSLCEGDTRTIAECLNGQNEKADRWLRAVVESYARLAAAYVAELKDEGEKEPFDQVAQLHKSQDLFEQFRGATTELVYRSGYPGSGSALQGAKARFQLTVDRARFLLSICDLQQSTKLPRTIDLTRRDWCEGQ